MAQERIQQSIPYVSETNGIKALKDAVWTEQELSHQLNFDFAEQREVIRTYRMRVPKYYLNLIEHQDDALWKQAIPDRRELEKDNLVEDPFLEDSPQYSPVPNLTHRYPDRALLLVTDRCPMYCRYCTRKRKTQKNANVTWDSVQQGIDYIRKTPQLREVILSGGDPLMLSDDRLRRILEALKSIPHIEVLRIHTRTPCVLPQRVTEELTKMLSTFHPLYVVVHFNHPREITPESSLALRYLADSGIPLSNQSVLLKGINDDPEIIKELCGKLLKNRVRPYYLHQADLVHGTDHFRTRVETGLAIIQDLQGQISGLAIPQYVIDGPGGGGKIPLQPRGQEVLEDKVILKNCDGESMIYPQVKK